MEGKPEHVLKFFKDFQDGIGLGLVGSFLPLKVDGGIIIITTLEVEVVKEGFPGFDLCLAVYS